MTVPVNLTKPSWAPIFDALATEHPLPRNYGSDSFTYADLTAEATRQAEAAS